MPLVVDEIFVGERDRGMNVLSSSVSDAQSQSLAHYLDLPGQPPQGYVLTSYVSGALIGNSYVVARTSSDPSAERNGMVFSHAIVVAKDDIEAFADLRAIFGHLQKARSSPLLAERRMISATGRVEEPPPGPFSDMVTVPSKFPAITVDDARFENLIIRLWAKLPPAMRSELRFGLSFGPDEAQSQGLQIALVPASLEMLWPLERRIDATYDQSPARTAAGRYLSSGSSGKLEAHIEDLNIHSISLSKIALLGRSCEIAEKTSVSFSDAVAALRVVGVLQPDPDKGTSVKRKILDAVLSRPGPAALEHIMAIRNVNWAPFNLALDQPEELEMSFANRMASIGPQDDVCELLVAMFDAEAATREWRRAGIGVLGAMTKNMAIKLAPHIWTLLVTNTEIGVMVLGEAPTALLDLAMSQTPPTIAGKAIEQLSPLLARARFHKSEAQLLLLSHPKNILAALEEACGRDHSVYGDTAIEYCLLALPDEVIVTSATSLDNDLVIEAGAKVVAKDPSFLFRHDISKSQVQTLWHRSLLKSQLAWQIAPDISSIQDRLFKAISGAGVNAGLLTILMSTPLGDWCAFECRAQVWGLLPSTCRSSALSETAASWIASYPANVGNPAFFTPEMPLAESIADDSQSHKLLAALKAGTFEAALDTFLGNHALPMGLFIDTFKAFLGAGRTPDGVELERAGRLAVARNWRTASRTFGYTFGVPRLKPYFVVCSDHLDSWTRFSNGLWRPSQEDLLILLLEVVCELYPNGPTQADVWEQAGGDLSRLSTHGSGRNQWREALRFARFGGEISLRDHLNAMLADYPLNSRLQQISGVIGQ